MRNIKETDDFILVDFETSSGARCEVGYPVNSGYTKENVEESIAKFDQKISLDSNGYAELRWQVGGECYTSQEAKDLGVESCEVQKSASGNYWDFIIVFTKAGCFTFKEKSGDTHTICTFRAGVHFIRFDYVDVTIIGVK